MLENLVFLLPKFENKLDREINQINFTSKSYDKCKFTEADPVFSRQWGAKGVHQSIIWKSPCRNCMKMKEIAPRGGGAASLVTPFGPANDFH